MEGAKPTGVMETTLELLQSISIQILTPDIHSQVFRGDRHKCRLYCWRCKQHLGNDDLGLANLLANAPMKILMHYQLFPRKSGKVWNSKGSDDTFLDLYEVTPSLFLTYHELGDALIRDND